MLTLLLSIFASLISRLKLEQARRLFRSLARLFIIGKGVLVENTAKNIDLCFPAYSAQKRKTLVQESIAETACLAAELGVFFRWPEERWLSLVAGQKPGLLEEVVSSDRGVLILGPHFGNWEFLGLYLGRLGTMALYNPSSPGWLSKPLLEARARSGMRMAPLSFGGLKEARLHLGSGGCLALLPDQVPRRDSGVYAPFFDVEALTMTFAHRLIQSTNPRVLVGAAKRVQNGFELSFSEPDRDIYNPSPLKSATAMNAAIEALVLTDPAQYQWEYKRFRRQQIGHKNYYA